MDHLVESALQQFGRIDILVCNAGIYPRGRVRTLTLQDYERCMSVNFYGALYLIQRVLPHMLQRKSGHIVVVSSVDGRKGLPMDAAYVSSKFAITGFMDVLRQEIHETGVYASTILPGRVDTPMIASLRVPLVSAKISSDRVARTVVRAIHKKKAEIIVPYLGPKALVVLSTISPRFGDWMVRFFRLEGKEETT
jgi:NAD(P)-dependent dehydrogenase (short-subunit alcohol dehydrogenase family)